MVRTRDAEAELNLPPGFRFHPTDEELVAHYLRRKATHQRLPISIIAEVDLYKFDPWELPGKALLEGGREWYFFTRRDRKYPNGNRPNRTTGKGYWKATGADKPVLVKGSNWPLGIKKALVFYSGKAPRSVKTDWIMHEYRLADTNLVLWLLILQLDEWVLCRLYNKKNAWEKMQQNKKESESFGEATESMDVEDAGSESLRTPESDVDDCFPEFDDLGNKSQVQMTSGNMLSFQGAEPDQRHPKEDNDWLLDLNLEDLEALGTTSMKTNGAFDVPLNQDYFF